MADWRFPVLLALAAALSFSVRAADLGPGFDAYARGDFETALAILRPSATVENPALQNMVGVMLYEGQGAEADPVAAHELFESAATLGIADAAKNLGMLYSVGAEGISQDHELARRWFTLAGALGVEDEPVPDNPDAEVTATIPTLITMPLEVDPLGEKTWAMFCGGCHGFDGMHFFAYSPSFAMGERMTKGDAELLRSIENGIGMMPGWDNKLSAAEIEASLRHLRALALLTGYGTLDPPAAYPPDFWYRFAPPGVPWDLPLENFDQ